MSRNRAKEGPQWELCHTLECAACHTLECAACWALECRHVRNHEVDWSWLPTRTVSPPCDGHHESSEYGNTRRDCDAMPLGTSRVKGGCGHHEDRTAQGWRFWGWRRTGPGLWERAPQSEREPRDTWLDVDPGLILIEMRSRVC